MRSYFEVLGIDKKLDIDTSLLESIYYDLSRKNHPDLFLSKGEDEYKKALDESSLINKAYSTLKEPISRANYIIETDSPGIFGEKTNVVHSDLLEDVMEMQEKIEDFHNSDEEAKKLLKSELLQIKNGLTGKLEVFKNEMKEIFHEYDNSTIEKIEVLKKLKLQLHKRNYLNTLIRTIESEVFGGEAIRH
ncbi:hypothetical protein BH10BAC5_BH10BAC5_12680 [soil metagenome]